MSCCCRSTLHNDRSETGRTLCAVEITHTNRSIHLDIEDDPVFTGLITVVSVAYEGRWTSVDRNRKSVFCNDVADDGIGPRIECQQLFDLVRVHQ